MKAVAAAIALLCVSSTVLAHDIYSNLRDNAGHLCCNGQDCKPVQATVLRDGNYYLPASDEIIAAEMATRRRRARVDEDAWGQIFLHRSATGTDVERTVGQPTVS
jgi:hypothetical protein